MRAGGLACALLLLASGASHALPQYGGAGVQQQQQEGQVGQQQQQQEEGGFWWQDKGVFESQVRSASAKVAVPVLVSTHVGRRFCLLGWLLAALTHGPRGWHLDAARSVSSCMPFF